MSIDLLINDFPTSFRKTFVKKICLQHLYLVSLYLSERDRALIFILYFCVPRCIDNILTASKKEIKDLIKKESLLNESWKDWMIKVLKLNEGSEDEIVYTTVKGKSVFRSHLYQAIGRSCKKSKIPKFTIKEITEWVPE